MVIDSLAQFQYDVLRRLNRKFYALQRLAQQLQILGDIAGLLPNLASLIPVGSIDVYAYERLRADCPFLGLPPFSNENLAALQAKVRAAYGALVGKLLNHPFNRLGDLQNMLSQYQTQLNVTMAIGTDYMRCLQTMCDTIGAVGTAFQNITTADISKEVSKYATNFVNNAGKVLTAPMEQRYQDVKDSVQQLKDLGADVKTDYDAASQAAGV